MRYLLMLLGIGLALALSAQHQLGLRTDTYAGISAAALNPAATGRTPWAWDLQLGGASFFMRNNYALLGNTSTPRLIKELRAENITFRYQRDVPDDSTPLANSVAYDFYEESSYYAQLQASMLGPGLSVQVAPNTRIGIFSAFHSMASLDNVDEDLGYYRWNEIPAETAINLSDMQFATAAWSELGLNVSQGIPTATGTMWLGVSVRRLWGQRAAYLTSDANFDLSKLPEYDGLEGVSFELEGGFTDNLTDETVDWQEQSGSGWGLDLGWWYQIPSVSDYQQWEFGLALLDLGSLRFDAAQVHRFTSSELRTVRESDYSSIDSEAGVGAIAEQFSEDVFGDATASLTDDGFILSLATSLSGQVRYNFNAYFGVEAAVVSALGSTRTGLRRKSVWSLSPRLEKYWWSLALPVSVHAGQEVRVGLAARLGPIVVGTDQLGSYFQAHQWDGTDAYFAIKWFPLGLNRDSNSRKRGAKRRGGRGKGVECYQF